MYKSLLLAADGSENSYRAAEELLNFAQPGETIVTILNVVDVNDSKSSVLHGTSTSVAESKKKLNHITTLFDETGIQYELKVEHGSPKEVVVEAANSGEYEAVVLGTRGLNGLQEMVLGSVSHKVAKRSSIPVIIVK